MKLEFPLIEVKGTAYEMGRQHGEQAGDLVRKYLLLIERLAGKPRDILCRNAERFLEVIERLSPKYVEEVRGLAEGAGISFAEALLCQVRTQALYGGEAGCTAFALRGEATLDGLILIGQNQEFEPEFAEVATLLRVCPTDGRPRALMITFAGQLGYSGINEFGVAHFANSLFNCNLRLGVPPYPMKRAILEQRSVAEAIALLDATTPARRATWCWRTGRAKSRMSSSVRKARLFTGTSIPTCACTATTTSRRNSPLSRTIPWLTLPPGFAGCAPC